MNQIRSIQALNKREIENGIPPEASWHTDYRDTAFVNFGGLPFNLSEGDILTIFSQYGEPVFLKLMRDKETGKSRGFGWLKYEDQRSCDLAVDNLGGAEVAGRLLRVDHARYKARDDEDDEECKVGWEDIVRKEKAARGEAMDVDETSEEDEPRRPMIREEKELAKLIAEHDEDDPMKGFLIEEKKREVDEALSQMERRGKKDKDRERRHRHKERHHRREKGERNHHSRREDSIDVERSGRQGRSRRDGTPVAKDGSRGDGTPEPRRGDSRERERRRRDSNSHDKRHDREQRRKGDDKDREVTRSRHHRGDRERDRYSSRRSRSRSPKTRRNRD
ncbi:hypothetical protein F5Y15DRAFT_165383 [Xylariaceae sp. FL0016]|nr:hypothetical protein F5Y15DRAFT_165383 [Xylariaceae sp. FL0016]